MAIFTHAVAPAEAAARTGDRDGRRAGLRSMRSWPGRGPAYRITRSGDHSFAISGRAVERLIARHDLTNQESLAYIEERLRAMGVIRELEAHGFEPGQEITIGEVAFDLYPGRRWE